MQFTILQQASYFAKHERSHLPQIADGNVLIAVGAMAPALGGSLSRFGLGGYLYLSELIGAVLMFIGFIRATSPMEEVTGH